MWRRNESAVISSSTASPRPFERLTHDALHGALAGLTRPASEAAAVVCDGHFRAHVRRPSSSLSGLPHALRACNPFDTPYLSARRALLPPAARAAGDGRADRRLPLDARSALFRRAAQPRAVPPV